MKILLRFFAELALDQVLARDAGFFARFELLLPPFHGPGVELDDLVRLLAARFEAAVVDKFGERHADLVGNGIPTLSATILIASGNGTRSISITKLNTEPPL